MNQQEDNKKKENAVPTDEKKPVKKRFSAILCVVLAIVVLGGATVGFVLWRQCNARQAAFLSAAEKSLNAAFGDNGILSTLGEMLENGGIVSANGTVSDYSMKDEITYKTSINYDAKNGAWKLYGKLDSQYTPLFYGTAYLSPDQVSAVSSITNDQYCTLPRKGISGILQKTPLLPGSTSRMELTNEEFDGLTTVAEWLEIPDETATSVEIESGKAVLTDAVGSVLSTVYSEAEVKKTKATATETTTLTLDNMALKTVLEKANEQLTENDELRTLLRRFACSPEKLKAKLDGYVSALDSGDSYVLTLNVKIGSDYLYTLSATLDKNGETVEKAEIDFGSLPNRGEGLTVTVLHDGETVTITRALTNNDTMYNAVWKIKTSEGGRTIKWTYTKADNKLVLYCTHTPFGCEQESFSMQADVTGEEGLYIVDVTKVNTFYSTLVREPEVTLHFQISGFGTEIKLPTDTTDLSAPDSEEALKFYATAEEVFREMRENLTVTLEEINNIPWIPTQEAYQNKPEAGITDGRLVDDDSGLGETDVTLPIIWD